MLTLDLIMKLPQYQTDGLYHRFTTIDGCLTAQWLVGV